MPENHKGYNIRWSVEPEGEKSWHIKVDGHFEKGQVIWIDRVTKSTGTSELTEVMVVDHIAEDVYSKGPASICLPTTTLSQSELEAGQTKPQARPKKGKTKSQQTKDLEAVVRENNHMLRMILEMLQKNDY